MNRMSRLYYVEISFGFINLIFNKMCIFVYLYIAISKQENDVII